MKSTPENLLVLQEENHLIFINKRAGDIIQGDKKGATPQSDRTEARGVGQECFCQSWYCGLWSRMLTTQLSN